MLEDTLVLNEYEKIRKFETASDESRAAHDISHINRVTKNCVEIAGLLDLDSESIVELKIAALLHDTGCVQGKEEHAERSYQWAAKYFKDKELNDEPKERILQSIKHHGKGAESAISKILAVADKVDICKQRILPPGLLVHGNRQYAHIQNVTFELNDNIFIVKFCTDGKINLQELNGYYFTEKVLHSIHNLAKIFGLESRIYLDNDMWLL